MPPKSFEKLEQERKAASQPGVPSAPGKNKAPGFEELNATIPVAAPLTEADIGSINTDFKEDMRLSDMTGLPMSIIGEYRKPIQDVEKKRAGFVEKFFQDPQYKYPGWGKVIQGIDYTRLKLAGTRLNAEDFSWVFLLLVSLECHAKTT